MGCVKFDTAHFILDIFTLFSVLCWLRPSCYRSLCNYKYVCITLTYSQLSLYSVLFTCTTRIYKESWINRELCRATP